MSRRNTHFVKGGYYHVYNRGAGRENIFREAENYRFVLRRFKAYTRQYRISVVAYCLMPNHYHFLLHQVESEAARLPVQYTFNSYTKAFNERYGRSGTLFEGPYKAIEVDDERYLVHLCRYIHANPVVAGLVAELGNWPYSNFREWMGMRKGTLWEAAFLEKYLDGPDVYRQLVEEYIQDRNTLAEGTEDFFLS